MNSSYIYIRKLVLDAVFIAAAVVLATILHSIGGKAAGSMWVPMWWGAFLAGIILGPIDGLIVGFLTPFISFITRGMPPYPFWLIFAIEIGVYGFMWGVIYALFEKVVKNKMLITYVSAVLGLILGKLAAALLLMFVIPSLAPKMAETAGKVFGMVFFYWTLKSLPGIMLLLVVGPIVAKYVLVAVGGRLKD